MNRDELEKEVAAALSPVVEEARSLTGDAQLWETHFVRIAEPCTASVFVVLQRDSVLEQASQSGVCAKIAEAVVSAVQGVPALSSFSRQCITFTTQEFCNRHYRGDWHQYFS